MKKILLIFPIILTLSNAQALPIDWHGSFGVDSTLVNNFRGLEQETESASITRGSQEVDLASDTQSNASYQTYVFRLNPTVIINDSASLKAELTNQSVRGGYLGDSASRNSEGTFGNALYSQNNGSGGDITFSQFYLLLYADTATYTLGRHTAHWGLGALVNEGTNTWDRFASTRDGVTIDFKIGNFNIKPFFSRVSTGASLGRSTRTKDFGLSFLYDNPERDITFGFLYQIRKSGFAEGSFMLDLDGDSTNESLGQTDVKVFDIYLSKTFGRFNFAIEVPLTSGELGHVYFADSITKYKAKGILFESSFEANNSWKFGLDAGKVSGDNGSQTSFDALYLNPNYQVANILFRYNKRAYANKSLTIHDSYITNALYAKLDAQYSVNSWVWNAAIIYAIAEETAKANESAFNHEKNKTFSAVAEQEDDLGIELDLGFEYSWNKEIKINGDFGYLMTGDYYAFNNTSTPLSADDTMIFKAGVSASF